MKHSTLARRRAWIISTLSDYRDLSDGELFRESAQLHRDLALSDQFSLTGARGLRSVVVERLLLIDAEHQRRLQPTAA